MLAARNYCKASATMRQLSLGKMDLVLHSDWPNANASSLESYIKTQLQGYHPEYKTEAPSNVFNFSHLFSRSVAYSAGYYSYKWAEVLDADAFTRFQKKAYSTQILGAHSETASSRKVILNPPLNSSKTLCNGCQNLMLSCAETALYRDAVLLRHLPTFRAASPYLKIPHQTRCFAGSRP